MPQIISWQGLTCVGAVNFNGSGSFKFALVNTDGATTWRNNDGTDLNTN